MIETPTATAFKATSPGGETTEVDAPLLSKEQISEKETLQALEQDLFLVKQPPITSKLRTAVKHLRSVAGPLARFRGLHVAILYHVVHGLAVNVFSPRGPGFTRIIVSVAVTTLLWRIQMAWTHIVISNPSKKAWYRRLPSLATAKKAVLPTAIYALAQQASIYIPIALFSLAANQFQHPEVYGNPDTVRKIAIIQAFVFVIISILCVFAILIPAEVTLKRVQASMLPEEDETIVPFDRTFGGKVKPELLGGSGAVSMLDAWKTFDREARWRLLKLYVKVIAIQITATIFFVMTIIGELRLIMGDDFNKALKVAHEQLTGKH